MAGTPRDERGETPAPEAEQRDEGQHWSWWSLVDVVLTPFLEIIALVVGGILRLLAWIIVGILGSCG